MPTAGFIELEDKTPQQFVTLILQCLALNEGMPPDHYTKIDANDTTQECYISIPTMTEPVTGVKQKPADSSPLSVLYCQLKAICAEVVQCPQLHNHPFLLALLSGKPPVAVADIYRHCCESDPNDLLWHISDTVKRTNAAPFAEDGFGVGRVSDLVAHMCLIAAARWISQEKIGKAHWVNDLPNIGMTEELAAALVAATWFDLGLQLRFNADGNIEVVNLICDRAETQFGVKTVEQAIDDEIFARVASELAVNGLGANGKPHPRDVKAGINRLEQSSGARLMVGLGTADARQSVDGALRNRIKDRWGIEMFVFADVESQPSEDIREEWASMQTSILGHFKRILSPLFWDTSSLTKKRTHSIGGNSMPRSKIFISYAHARLDKNRLKELDEHLKVLETQGLVDIWDDSRIGAGQDWYNEIDGQLQSCKVAVFLISPAFLGSTFITTVEVPTLLDRHQQQGMHVVPLLIRDCAWKTVPWLSAMQMRPADAEPLSDKPRRRDQQLKQVALEIANLCQ